MSCIIIIIRCMLGEKSISVKISDLMFPLRVDRKTQLAPVKPALTSTNSQTEQSYSKGSVIP